MSEPGWIEPEAARTGLLLFAPPAPPAALDAVLATGALVAFVAPLAAEPSLWREARAACRRYGVAFLVQGDAASVPLLDADGVHLGEPGLVAEARRLGADALIGAACGGSRHAAMVAGEDGADYVVFSADGEVADLCAWWSELFVLPCAADLREFPADPAGLIAAGADFIAVESQVWAAPDPAAAARELGRKVQGGRQPQKAE